MTKLDGDLANSNDVSVPCEVNIDASGHDSAQEAPVGGDTCDVSA